MRTEGEGLREIGKSHSVPRALFVSDAIDGSLGRHYLEYVQSNGDV